MNIEVKKINSSFSKGQQSVTYKEILTIGKNKCKIVIKRDSYDFQSHANIEVFDNMKWNRLDHIPYANMDVCIKNVYHVNAVEYQFANDRDALISLAKDILG